MSETRNDNGDRQLAVRQQPAAMPLSLNSLQDLLTLGKVLAESGFFADARGTSQAVVKVLAGRELGFQTIASMTGIHVIEGKPSVGAHLMAAMIKRSGRYDYRVLRCDREACELEFYENRQAVGRTSMTMQEAVQTGLAVGRDGKLKSNWSRSGDDMLFARCISKGFRRHCPDLTAGVTVYDPDELDHDPPPAAGPIAVEVVAPQPPAPSPAPSVTEGNVPSPATVATTPPANVITEAQQQEVIALVQERQVPTDRVRHYLSLAGSPMLKLLPPDRLPWLKLALTEGLATEEQITRLAAALEAKAIPEEAVRARLREKYGVDALSWLAPSQATEIESALNPPAAAPAA